MRHIQLWMIAWLMMMPWVAGAQVTTDTADTTLAFEYEYQEPEIFTPTVSLPDTLPTTVATTLNADSINAVIDRLLSTIDSLNGIGLKLDAANLRLDSTDHEIGRLNRRLAIVSRHRDSLLLNNERYQKELQEKNTLLESQVKAMQEKETLFAEKEELYRKAISSNDVDKAKFEGEIQSKNISIEAKAREIAYLQRDLDSKTQTLTAQKEDYDRLTKERDRYLHIMDSLRALVRAAELENVRKDEANKYLAQRAREAEEKISAATNKKKKVRPIQGVAMRFYRTPDWELYLNPRFENGTTTYDKQVRNRNAGKVEFDFVTGASVMLWDMTPIFNAPRTDDTASITTKSALRELPKFDQQFSYDLGFYVGFGGSNLFKNFYIGPSFRFMDFFYLNAGVNIAEFEELDSQYDVNTPIDPSLNLANITSKVWKVTPFISFNLDLDFLSYIKR